MILTYLGFPIESHVAIAWRSRVCIACICQNVCRGITAYHMFRLASLCACLDFARGKVVRHRPAQPRHQVAARLARLPYEQSTFATLALLTQRISPHSLSRVDIVKHTESSR